MSRYRDLVLALLCLPVPGAASPAPAADRAELRMAELYARRAGDAARALRAEAALAPGAGDRALWRQTATTITFELGRAERHLARAQASEPDVVGPLRRALAATLRLAGSLAHEDHRQVAHQAAAVQKEADAARAAVEAHERALGMVALDAITPSARAPTSGRETLDLELDDRDLRVQPPQRLHLEESLPSPPQPGDVTTPPPAPRESLPPR